MFYIDDYPFKIIDIDLKDVGSEVKALSLKEGLIGWFDISVLKRGKYDKVYF